MDKIGDDMNKTKKMIYISFLDIVLFAVTFILYFNDMMNYVFVTGTITLILFLYLCYMVFAKKDEITLYNKKIKEILKTYDSILVYSDKKIIIEKENIVQIKTLESLLTAQEELKKPIIYLEEKNANHFILNDENEMLVYTMKLNKEIESNFENQIKEYLINKNNKNKKKKRILNDLENTTIIKLDDDKFYKVSPMKNKKK